MSEPGGPLGVDHVAIAVADLEEASTLFARLLGMSPVWVREFPEQEVRVAMFRVPGVKIELLQGTNPLSAVARFVQKRGPGLHHICYAVKDLKSTLARLAEEGIKPLGAGDETGVEGRPITFLHPKSTGGVLTEFIEGVEE